jgi:hypothetical protein
MLAMETFVAVAKSQDTLLRTYDREAMLPSALDENWSLETLGRDDSKFGV